MHLSRKPAASYVGFVPSCIRLRDAKWNATQYQCDTSGTRPYIAKKPRSVLMSDSSYVVIHEDDEEAGITPTLFTSSSSSIANDTLGPDQPFIEDCDTCNNTGFVLCTTCNGDGYLKNPRSSNVFYCHVCVGHKKLRCPSCGGKCYMCE